MTWDRLGSAEVGSRGNVTPACHGVSAVVLGQGPAEYGSGT
jgi:hypothetical protein